MRTILHSDLNNFYASVECLKHPEYKDMPVAVVGEKEERHGIVLAKNQIAKKAGVKTGDVYWLARQKCPGLIEITADFPAYIKASVRVRKIYEDYTDRIEAFGIDECWLDVTESEKLFGNGERIAELIRERVKRETGLTVSIGVSWNKIFAKLGSDMKKPDAVTVITPENYRDVVWNLPVGELLYVGRATERKLKALQIETIGHLAQADEELLKNKLGKWGEYLRAFARGEDNSAVRKIDEVENVKSIGNSLTNYRDVDNFEEARVLIYLLAESVAGRMRESGLTRARTVSVFAVASNLEGFRKQGRLAFPSGAETDIAGLAEKLFSEVYPWTFPLRGLGITVSDFVLKYEQLDIFGLYAKTDKNDKLAAAIDMIRAKYGNNIIQRAIIYKDSRLKDLDVKGEHTIHPYSFFK